jgi:hypothetical protein
MRRRKEQEKKAKTKLELEAKCAVFLAFQAAAAASPERYDLTQKGECGDCGHHISSCSCPYTFEQWRRIDLPHIPSENVLKHTDNKLDIDYDPAYWAVTHGQWWSEGKLGCAWTEKWPSCLECKEKVVGGGVGLGALFVCISCIAGRDGAGHKPSSLEAKVAKYACCHIRHVQKATTENINALLTLPTSRSFLALGEWHCGGADARNITCNICCSRDLIMHLYDAYHKFNICPQCLLQWVNQVPLSTT